MTQRTHLWISLRRRGWIILVAIVAVGAVSLAMTTLLSKSHSASGVLMVPPGANQGVPLSADQAASLARNYTSLIPQDQNVANYVAQHAGVSPAVARARIAVTQQGKTGLVSLSYSATSRSKARKGAEALLAAVTGTSPVTSNVVPGSLQRVDPPSVSGAAGAYVARARAAVPPSPPAEGPGDADAAIKLATTYAGLLPEDTQTIHYVARHTGLSEQDVRSGLTVTNDPNSAVLRVRFRAKSGRDAVNGLREFAAAVSGGGPVSTAVTPRSLNTVRLPDSGSAASAGSTKKTLAIGLVLGLALGIVLLVAWERADPRLDTHRRLSDGLGAPATAFDGMSSGSLAALLDRWSGLGRNSDSRVALLAAAPQAEPLMSGVVERLIEAAQEDGRTVQDGRGASGFGPVTVNDNLTLVAGGTPGTDAAGERLAAGADMTVLVVPRGAHAGRVSRSVAVLEQFGVSPGWALLVRPLRAWKRRGEKPPPAFGDAPQMDGAAAADHLEPADFTR
jgi:capsular polysaccharide biosynthesis protein